MEGTCRANSASTLADKTNGLFFTEATNFPLRVGAIYKILGIALINHGLGFLVRADTGLPTWLPAALFSLEDQPLPPGWKFATLDVDDRRNQPEAIWGYAELVDSEEHFDGLMNRDPAALDIFDRAEALV
jgi:hypothetical protein